MGNDNEREHAPTTFGRAFAIGIALNTAYVVIEGIYGVASNSLALLADAGHNLSDVLGLAVAWGAAVLTLRPPSQRYTYGLRGSSILAALFNSTFLLLTFGAIGWEAIQRLFQPQPIGGVTVMIVAAVGILVNWHHGLVVRLRAQGRPEHTGGVRSHGVRRRCLSRRRGGWTGDRRYWVALVRSPSQLGGCRRRRWRDLGIDARESSDVAGCCAFRDCSR